jgi:hypothetical protein
MDGRKERGRGEKGRDNERRELKWCRTFFNKRR